MFSVYLTPLPFPALSFSCLQKVTWTNDKNFMLFVRFPLKNQSYIPWTWSTVRQLLVIKIHIMISCTYLKKKKKIISFWLFALLLIKYQPYFITHFGSVFSQTEVGNNFKKSARFQKSVHVWINPHGWQHCNTHKTFSKIRKKKPNICSTSSGICQVRWDEVNI